MLRHYLQLSWKVLQRRKFFTFASIFGISFTLAVLMIATAMIDHVFAAHPPETNLDRRLGVYFLEARGPESSRSGHPGWRFLDRHVRDLPGAESTSIFQMQAKVLSFDESRRNELWIKRTDAEFWKVLDFEFIAGNPFGELDVSTANYVAVVNESTAANFFGNAEAAIGETIEVDQQRFRVVGVVRDVPFIRLLPFADIWVPSTTAKSAAYREEEVTGNSMALVLAKDRASLPVMQEEFASRVAAAPPRSSDFTTVTANLDTFFNAVASEFDLSPHILKTIFVVMALLFMGLPAINLINMNLSRIMERASEIGVRKSFGARSRALVGQFIVENVVLTVLGGIVGFGISGIVLAALNRSGIIPYAQLSLNFRIFLAGFLMALIFGIVSGVWPAWRMSRMHPVDALRGADR
ncbi:MAG: ABC transporter permease [Acidobacteria bacterium]|nr:ABC transporter permease [Acidobacteriota bacterium]